jgi:hypothetical protein
MLSTACGDDPALSPYEPGVPSADYVLGELAGRFGDRGAAAGTFVTSDAPGPRFAAARTPGDDGEPASVVVQMEVRDGLDWWSMDLVVDGYRERELGVLSAPRLVDGFQRPSAVLCADDWRSYAKGGWPWCVERAAAVRLELDDSERLTVHFAVGAADDAWQVDGFARVDDETLSRFPPEEMEVHVLSDVLGVSYFVPGT